MKILNLCERDYAGVGIALTRALQKHAGKEHQARHLCLNVHRFRYATDLVTRDIEELHRWIKWADVVNTHVTFGPVRIGDHPPKPKKLVITFHGTHYRGKHEALHRKMRKMGVRVALCTTADLTKYGVARWIPTAIPMDRYAKMRRGHPGKPIVMQVPSNPKRKNTAEIYKLLSGREDFRMITVHHRFHNEALHHMASADILIDRFKLGVGVSGLEGMAMGIPVIANASPEDEKLILKHVGYLPYYKAGLNDLAVVVEALLSDKALYRSYVERGRQYIRDFHDYPVVAKRYMEIVERRI